MSDIVLHTAPDFDHNNMTFIPMCLRWWNNAHMFCGAGVPNIALGLPGDYYFRTDGGGKNNQNIYLKLISGWRGLV